MSVTPTVGEHSSTPRPPKYAFGKNNCVSASAVASTICMIEILTFFHALVSVVMPVFKLFQCYSTKYQNMCLLLLFFGKQLNSSKKRLKFLDVFHHLGFCLCCKAVHSDQGFEKQFSTYCIFASYFIWNTMVCLYSVLLALVVSFTQGAWEMFFYFVHHGLLTWVCPYKSIIYFAVYFHKKCSLFFGSIANLEG